jgi:hypothetical protein
MEEETRCLKRSIRVGRHRHPSRLRPPLSPAPRSLRPGCHRLDPVRKQCRAPRPARHLQHLLRQAAKQHLRQTNPRKPSQYGVRAFGPPPLSPPLLELLLIGAIAFAGIHLSHTRHTASPPPIPILSTTTTPPTLAPAKPEVRVYNISDQEGLADRVAARLRDAGWDVTATGNLTPGGVNATTVYFSRREGEKEAAEEVGTILEAPVEPRSLELDLQPAGVIVLVTG